MASFAGLFGHRNKGTPSVPEGLRVYAIGDIHGCAELLRALVIKIFQDIAQHNCKSHLVFLGDYVDRGMKSATVIDMLIDIENCGVASTFLAGNHEDALQQFFNEPMIGPHWFGIGGLATVMSYGVSAAEGGTPKDRFNNIRDSLRAAMPPAHQHFLSRLLPMFELGDYLFAHAGIRPGVALGRQSREDLLSIRGDFTMSRERHPKRIVHGHSAQPAPVILPNRICVDTGAYATGRLTCVVLDGVTAEMISVEMSSSTEHGRVAGSTRNL